MFFIFKHDNSTYWADWQAAEQQKVLGSPLCSYKDNSIWGNQSFLQHRSSKLCLSGYLCLFHLLLHTKPKHCLLAVKSKSGFSFIHVAHRFVHTHLLLVCNVSDPILQTVIHIRQVQQLICCITFWCPAENLYTNKNHLFVQHRTRYQTFYIYLVQFEEDAGIAISKAVGIFIGAFSGNMFRNGEAAQFSFGRIKSIIACGKIVIFHFVAYKEQCFLKKIPRRKLLAKPTFQEILEIFKVFWIRFRIIFIEVNGQRIWAGMFWPVSHSCCIFS